MKIQLGELELLESKRLYLPPDEKIRITLSEAPPPLVINISAKMGEGERKFERKLIGNSELEIVFYNFKEPLGVYATRPARLGTYLKRELFWSWGVSFISPDFGHEVEVLFYLGKETP
jgi:hypothetical protein